MLLADAERALYAGVNNLALWDVDPTVPPPQLGEFLRSMAMAARRHGREPVFSFIPITWEELDWEFLRYSQERSMTRNPF